MKSLQKRSCVFLATLLLMACAHKVSRIDPSKNTDLSGRWNDTDSRLVSQDMVKDVLSRPWLSNFNQNKNKKPVVIVGDVLNNTTEHIDANTFISDIEREFVNSGNVRLVQNGDFRNKLRTERNDQQSYASQETMKQFGKELGADYMMFGTVTSITDEYKKQRTILYKINLQLSDLETNETVWIGDKEIKKLIVR